MKPYTILKILFLTLVTGIIIVLPTTPGSAQQSITWEEPVNFSNQPNTFSWSPIMVCDAYHNTYAFWAERETTRQLIFTSQYHTTGWTPPNDIILTDNVRFLNSAASADDFIYLAWVNIIHGNLNFALAPLSQVNNPYAWQGPFVLAQWVDSVSMALSSDNAIHLVYVTPDEEGNEHEILYIQSTDHGDTWSEPVSVWSVTTVNPSLIDLMLKVDTNDRLHLAYTIGSYTYGKYREVGYIRSTDQGKTWSSPRKIASSDTPPGVAVAGVYTFGANEIHLTYDLPDRMHTWSTDGGITWSDPVLIVDLGAAFGGYNQLAKDSRGTLHVIAAVSDGVYHAIWNPQTESWGTAQRIDDRYIDPHNQQISICAGNRLDVLYDDRTGDNEVWYTYAELNIPGYTAQLVPPLPTPTPTPAQPTSTPILPTPTSTLQITNTNVSKSNLNQILPILIALLPVTLLLLISFIFISIRMRR